MITVFARDYSSTPSIIEQSVYFQPDVFPGTSYVDSGTSPELNIDGTGFTFATWVKPDWSSGQQGAPAKFMQLTTTTPSNQYFARFGYDSETTNDELFLQVGYYFDGIYYEIWANAPLTANPINQAITTLPPNPTNSWNNTTMPGFTHVAVTLDMTTENWPEFTTDISPRFTIFWNGVPLETFEWWNGATGNPALLNLDGFENDPTYLTVGPDQWNRAHWQDRTVFHKQFTTNQDIFNNYYAGGSPQDPVPNANFHYNWQGASPYDSNGISPLTMVQQSLTPGSFPAFDQVNYV